MGESILVQNVFKNIQCEPISGSVVLGSYYSYNDVYFINSDSYNGVAEGIPGPNISSYKYVIFFNSLIFQGKPDSDATYGIWRIDAQTLVGGSCYSTSSSSKWLNRSDTWTYTLTQTGDTFTFTSTVKSGVLSKLFLSANTYIVVGVKV